MMGIILIMGVSMVRKPAVAGQFYPSSPKTLLSMVKQFVDGVQVEVNGEIKAIIVPHAGYPYSGPTAGYAFRAIKGRDYSTVILIGGSHRAYFEGIAVYPEGEWETPLGTVEVDEELAQKIIDYDPSIQPMIEPHLPEHSLEVELPFLQYVLEDFRIVPVLLGRQDERNVNILTQAIYSAIKDRDDVLLLASSDLYHGYSYTEAKKTDERVNELVIAQDASGLMEFDEVMEGRGACAACGAGAIAVVLKVCKLLGCEPPELLHLTTSADVVGGKREGEYVVGYGAWVITWQDPEIPHLTEEEKKYLLKLARETIEHAVRGEAPPKAEPITPRLEEPWGCFVTLTKHGELRGCIGLIKGIKPLYLAVQDMAIAAALRDPRFPPVSPSELDEIEIEISVLTPLKEVKDVEEIKVGRDGIYIERGYHSGLLLPQVATEYGWTREEFLDHTCMKAGLFPGCWKEEGTKIYRFSALIFSE